jgi:hypothetical protein
MDKNSRSKADYIDESGFYVIENYDIKPPFASFLSGVAGIEGIPMWSFYVNRGQVISSIGIKDKNNCIMEFFPANEAYKMVTTNGFRTFIKIISDNSNIIIEPFSVSRSENIKRILKIKNNELRIIEINKDINLEIEVKYFTIPNEKFAALGRELRIINKSNIVRNIEVLDGLAAILPYGSNNKDYKEIGNTLRSWMQGEIKENNVAIYNLRSSTGDTTKVEMVNNAYFYIAFDDNEKVLKPIVDPENIFGYDTSLVNPFKFKNSVEKLFESNENICYNKVPCAFSGKQAVLTEKEEVKIHSYIGYMNSINEVDDSLNKLLSKKYFNEKIIESNKLIDKIAEHVNTVTNYSLFDEYIKQCYIDNVLRGGYPLKIGKNKVYYVYSRKHGDLERDYNFFNIEPNFYSQGNGNFRDINQNRRMDIYIHPFTNKENIKLFNNLIQLDGYNPLVIKGKKFYIDKNRKASIISILKKYEIKNEDILYNIYNNEFTLGELYSYLLKEQNLSSDKISILIDEIIDICEEKIEADFGEGFWIDHWTYNLDLIEEYLDVYPDKLKELLIDDMEYKFYNSPEHVLPRSEKYIIDNNTIRQYVALNKKGNVNQWIYNKEGKIYKTNLITKLFMLTTIKFMTLDVMGFGIEMEAGKPGWNDAMNGLPGLIGSSFAETAELKRLACFIKENINLIETGLKLPVEFYDVVKKLTDNLSKNLNDILPQSQYWDIISNIREDYREKVKYSIDGTEKILYKDDMENAVDKMIQKIDIGIDGIKELNDGKIPTFMYYEAVKFTKDKNGNINPIEFKINFLPLFLEGYARYLKTNLEEKEKKEIYITLKNSDIYDKKLKMYKTSESLEKVTFEIGRARTFTSGWLERESIFMHMEFKYILELIKEGLYEEFYEDIKNVLPPFMDSKVYGRSILENSSFIASSANPDERTHGRGFIARLSGTTVEMLSIWKIMTVGKNIFKYENGVLEFELMPVLSKDFFKNNVIETTLLGSIRLKYINKNNKDTFGSGKGNITKYELIGIDNNIKVINQKKILGTDAEKIRSGQIREIIATIE